MERETRLAAISTEARTIMNRSGFAVLVFANCALTGCTTTTTPNVAVTGRDEVHQMSRQEIITASIECTDAGMRPQLVTASRKINNRPTDIVIDVTCYPKYKY